MAVALRMENTPWEERQEMQGEPAEAHKTIFLCGIGGSGMSAIAQVLRHHGHAVRGSDRSRDRGENRALYEKLSAQGIALYPQDGSGVDRTVDELVVSTAVEETIPDVRAALAQGIPIRKRAEMLAGLFNGREGVAVGGTSGKTTVTGMIGHILRSAGKDPTVIAGGIMLNAAEPPFLGNAICGRPDLPVIEADESDGSIALYDPAVSVLTNISLDHKPLEELRPLFRDFCARARRAVILNLDCEESAALTGINPNTVTFGIENPDAELRAEAVEMLPDGVRFRVGDVRFRLRVPGRHNVANALAAVAACHTDGVSVSESADALSGFLGIQRRLQVVGQAAGITVVDDFAHNPDKIAASLAALKAHPGRLRVMFQPHGFGPTRFLKDGLVDAFAEGLGVDDLLVMPEIYYAGGTAQKDISSQDLIQAVAARGRRAEFIPQREAVAHRLADASGPGDRVVIMGARDDTLTTFAQTVLEEIRGREPGVRGQERNHTK